MWFQLECSVHGHLWRLGENAWWCHQLEILKLHCMENSMYIQKTQWFDQMKTQKVVSNLLCRYFRMLFCPQFWLLLAILQWCGIFAICLVYVNGGWPMVVHCLGEMRVIFEAVSICNQAKWPFSFTDTDFRFDLVLGEKVATRLFVCVFLCYLCLSCGHLCVILCTGGVQ